jgi:hypothetical protein
VFTTSARVFHRALRLLTENNPYNSRQEPWTHCIAEETWNHADPETAATALTLSIPSLPTSEALVVVEEGDNSSIPIRSVRLLLPAYRMRFFRGQQTDLTLYYGSNDIRAPRYDLEILAPRLIGAAAEEVSMDPESAEAPSKTKSMPHRLFWGTLVVVVVALLVLVARLLRQNDEETAS